MYRRNITYPAINIYNYMTMKVIVLESITLNPNSIMEATLLSVPMVQNHSSFAEEAEYVPFEEVREEEKVSIKSNVNFLEANTSEISIEELTSQCVVPTWANQELTISHQDFIHTVFEAAQTMFSGETINEPAIRVSHIEGSLIVSPENIVCAASNTVWIKS